MYGWVRRGKVRRTRGRYCVVSSFSLCYYFVPPTWAPFQIFKFPNNDTVKCVASLSHPRRRCEKSTTERPGHATGTRQKPCLMWTALLVGAVAAGIVGRTASETVVVAAHVEPSEHKFGDQSSSLPLVVNTWTGDFAGATKRAWSVVSVSEANSSALMDAIEVVGCKSKEKKQHYVSFQKSAPYAQRLAVRVWCGGTVSSWSTTSPTVLLVILHCRHCALLSSISLQ